MNDLPNHTLRRTWPLFAPALLLLAAVAAHAGSWAGKVTTVRGVKTVVNPATPYEAPATVKLHELWRVGGASDAAKAPAVIADIDIEAGSGDVFLLDGRRSSVKVYSKDGAPLRTVGREGDGPGEFRRPCAVFFMPDGKLAVASSVMEKIVLFSRDGKPAGDVPLPAAPGGGFQVCEGAQARGGNIVLKLGGQTFDHARHTWSRATFLAAVTPEGRQNATYCTKNAKIDMAAPMLDDAAWDTFERRWQIGPDGRVYACTSYDNYEITVYAANGAVERAITREYRHLPRTAQEKEAVKKSLNVFAAMMRDGKVHIREHAKDIDSFHVRDDGAIWVLTSEGSRAAAGTLGMFDVLNPEGRFVKNVTLEGEGNTAHDLYVLDRDRLYVVTGFRAALGNGASEANGNGVAPMSVICYRLDGEAVAAK